MTLHLITDTREQDNCYTFTGYDCTVTEATLETGDYSMRNFELIAAIERKELNDLVSCLMGDNRTRFKAELKRGSKMRLFSVVVEASLDDIRYHKYHSKMKPHAVMQSIFAMHTKYGTPFWFAGSRKGAEYLVYSIFEKFAADIEKQYAQLTKSQRSKDGAK